MDLMLTEVEAKRSSAGERLRILLAGDVPGRLASLAVGLRTLSEAEILQAASAAEALALLGENPVDLVVIDEQLNDAQGLELAGQLARRHPFVSCMLVDGRSPEQFHQATEGLGVLLQLPSPPEMADARSVLEQLAAVGTTGAIAHLTEAGK